MNLKEEFRKALEARGVHYIEPEKCKKRIGTCKACGAEIEIPIPPKGHFTEFKCPICKIEYYAGIRLG